MLDNTSFFKARVKMLLKKENDWEKNKLKNGIYLKLFN